SITRMACRITTKNVEKTLRRKWRALMRTAYKMTLGAAFGLAAALSFQGTPSAQTATPQRGGTAIFTLPQDASSVNADTTTNLPDRLLGCILYQGMLHISPDYKLMPLLAKSWSVSPDGLTYTFNLVDTQWSDGKPLTSEDVKYTLTE